MTPIQVRSQTSPTGGDPPKQFPEGFTLALAAVFGAVIVLAGMVVFRELGPDSEIETAADEPTVTAPARTPQADSESGDSSGFGDLPNRGGTTPESQDPPETDPELDSTDEGESGGQSPGPAPPDFEPLACPEGVEAVICDAAAFVQQIRARPFRTFPEVEVLSDEVFDRELLADFDDYRSEFDVDEVLFKALGLLSPDVSLAEAYRDIWEVGVVGFYDTETGQLVVRGENLDLYGQLVLVHELTHAFDDQWFDLSRTIVGDDEGDRSFSSVVEGNANRVEELWRAELTSEELAALEQQELSALSLEDVERYRALPAIIRDLQASPYIDGAHYVDLLVAEGGELAADEALETPPATSEEILHPGERANDVEIQVAAPEAGGPIVDEGRLGELVIRLWLGRWAAEGWGGDRFVSWTIDGSDCMAADLVGDNDRETMEMAAAANAWANLASDRRLVETISTGGRSGVRVTACS